MIKNDEKLIMQVIERVLLSAVADVHLMFDCR